MRRMKKWLVVCSLLLGAGAIAQDAKETGNAETWIPLEDLPPDDQAAALDAEEKDRDKRAVAPEWSEATEQLVLHAIFEKALNDVGASLLPGTPGTP